VLERPRGRTMARKRWTKMWEKKREDRIAPKVLSRRSPTAEDQPNSFAYVPARCAYSQETLQTVHTSSKAYIRNSATLVPTS
jgi:hypothetical protein